MINKLKENGVRIDSIYYCPHLQKDNCSCRKPRPGMLLRAVRDFDINLSQSWLIGDDERDIIFGREANIRTIKIGKHVNKSLKVRPNYYVTNLQEAVDIIIEHESAA
jgi:histidinol-phosphate phosphatase family protein